MYKLKTLSVVAVIVFLVSACSNKVYVERDKAAPNLNAYRTYAWIRTSANKDDSSGPSANISDLVDRNIKEAVNARLAQAGLRQDDQRPDMLVTYDLLQEKGLHQSPNSVYGQPFSRWYYNPYAHGWYSLYYPSQVIGYDSGEYQDDDKTVTISFIDAKTNKTIVQAWTTNHTNRRRVTSKEIARSVEDIFRKLDIAKT